MTTRDHRDSTYRDGVTWRYAITHDPDLSDLARAVALHMFDDHDRLPIELDTARIAARRGVTERDVDFALDELQEPRPGYVRLFTDGAVFLSFDRRHVRDRARQLAAMNRTTIGRVLHDAGRTAA